MALPIHPRTLLKKIVYFLISTDQVLSTECLNEKGTFEVSLHRNKKYFEQELPAISIYSTTGSDDDQNTAPKVFKRDISLEVQIMERDYSGADEFLDGICRRIEFILLRWNGIVLDAVTKEKLDKFSDFTMTGFQQGLFSQGDTDYSGVKMMFTAKIYDDDITGDQDEDFSFGDYTIENGLYDFESLSAEIVEAENGAKIEIALNLN